MKKTILTAILALFIGSTVMAQHTVKELPKNAQDFLKEHFSSETVDKVDEDKSWFSFDKNEMYEVHLANGVRIDFNKEGDATEITTRKDAVIPKEALPSAIVDYMESNYSRTAIVAWEMDKDKQEVELEDGREFEFDLQGKFQKED